MSKDLQFRVSSAIKSIIGRDLITNDFVAIFELVKNSVDAGASQVDIFFDLTDDENSSIYIIDNGKGMSFEDIDAKWLFLGYSAKREGTEDEAPKVYAGNKGVGRFSCDRLGAHLQLQSRNESKGSVHSVKVDWGDFEQDPKEFFSNINLEYEATDRFVTPQKTIPPTTGVILKISKLREESSWNRQKLLDLRNNLQKLINPFGDSSELIKIHIYCPREQSRDKEEKVNAKSEDRPAILANGLVRNKILETLQQKTTWLNSHISTEGYLYLELHDRGELIYKTRERVPEELEILTRAEYIADIYFLNRSAKATFGRRMGVASRDFGSLFLIRNGFRVFPVGDEGNDYWHLDRRRAQGHSRYLGNRDIMGKIEVSGNELDFKESSSRDKGLIDTPASLALKNCVMVTIRKLERYVVGVTWKDVLDKDSDNLDRMMLDTSRARIIALINDLSDSKSVEVLDYNKNIVNILGEKSEEFEPSLEQLKNVAIKFGDDGLIHKIEKAEKVLKKAKQAEYEALALAEKEESARRKAEKAAREAEEAAEKAKGQKAAAEEALDEELKRNRFLTSSSSRDKEQLENFIHQMIYFAAHNRQLIQNQIKSMSKKEGREWKKPLNALYELREGIEKIIATSRYLTSADFRLKSGKIKDDLVGFIKEHLETMAPMYSTGVDIGCQIPPKEFIVEFPPIELAMIMDNLISNSKKARASQISFQLTVEPKLLNLVVTDNGKGLDPGIKNSSLIFERGVTRTRGSGLGLHFCREQVILMGGDIFLTDPQPETGFSITLQFIQS